MTLKLHVTDLEARLKSAKVEVPTVDMSAPANVEDDKEDTSLDPTARIAKLKARSVALSIALDSIKKQFVDYQGKTQEILAEKGGETSKNMGALNELQEKIMKEIETSLKEREATSAARAEALDLEAKLGQSERALTAANAKFKSDLAEQVTAKQDAESKRNEAIQQKVSRAIKFCFQFKGCG